MQELKLGYDEVMMIMPTLRRTLGCTQNIHSLVHLNCSFDAINPCPTPGPIVPLCPPAAAAAALVIHNFSLVHGLAHKNLNNDFQEST